MAFSGRSLFALLLLLLTSWSNVNSVGGSDGALETGETCVGADGSVEPCNGSNSATNDPYVESIAIAYCVFLVDVHTLNLSLILSHIEMACIMVKTWA